MGKGGGCGAALDRFAMSRVYSFKIQSSSNASPFRRNSTHRVAPDRARKTQGLFGAFTSGGGAAVSRVLETLGPAFLSAEVAGAFGVSGFAGAAAGVVCCAPDF